MGAVSGIAAASSTAPNHLFPGCVGCVAIESPRLSQTTVEITAVYARLNLKWIVTTLIVCRIGRTRFLNLGGGRPCRGAEREREKI